MTTLHRRRAMLLAGSALLLSPRFGRAQKPAKVWHIGYLSGAVRPADGETPVAWRAAMEKLGYVSGRNVTYTARWANAKPEALPQLAAELVNLDIDLLVTFGAPAAQAAKQATKTIPIVVVAPGDAVGVGLVSSLARPGGNLTGTTDLSTELSAKRLGILKEAVPGAARIAVIWNVNDKAMTLRYGEVERAAHVLNVAVQPFAVRKPEDIDAALATMTRERPDAVFVVSDSLTTGNRKRILEFASSQQVPAMYEFGVFVHEGGLMSYGPTIDEMYARAASYIDRILKGAHPGDLPLEQPTGYFLLINLKTAKSLGLTIPSALLLRADELIQ